MLLSSLRHRPSVLLSIILLGTLLWIPEGGNAQAQAKAQLILKPHCTQTDRTTCPSFQVVDAEHLHTPPMKAGDILDIDVVLLAANPKEVSLVRSWLNFDPNLLEARSVELSSALPRPLPGEQTIDLKAGVIKIGGGTDGTLTATEVPVARVTFRVLSALGTATISFKNFTIDGTGETAVNGQNGIAAVPLLSIKPSALLIEGTADSGVVASSFASTSGLNSSEHSSSSPSTLRQSAFTLLQVQDVRVTSNNRNIFLGWQALPSTELLGYNVYYGTVSGRYIQRRSLPATSTSLVIRDLEPNTQYFLAVRAFASGSKETVFSHEVAVVVGKPETSTAPLSQTPSDESSPYGNPIGMRGGTEVQGATGLSDTLGILLLISACIGTVLAWRKQLSRT